MNLIGPALVFLAFLFGLAVGMRWRRSELAGERKRVQEFHDEVVKVSQRGPDWHRVHVPKAGRGPNADELYNGIIVSGRGYLFTFEDCRDARGRSQQYWR